MRSRDSPELPARLKQRRGSKGEPKANLIPALYKEVLDLTLIVTRDWNTGVRGQLGA